MGVYDQASAHPSVATPLIDALSQRHDSSVFGVGNVHWPVGNNWPSKLGKLVADLPLLLAPWWRMAWLLLSLAEGSSKAVPSLVWV